MYNRNKFKWNLIEKSTFNKEYLQIYKMPTILWSLNVQIFLQKDMETVRIDDQTRVFPSVAICWPSRETRLQNKCGYTY